MFFPLDQVMFQRRKSEGIFFNGENTLPSGAHQTPGQATAAGIKVNVFRFGRHLG